MLCEWLFGFVVLVCVVFAYFVVWCCAMAFRFDLGLRFVFTFACCGVVWMLCRRPLLFAVGCFLGCISGACLGCYLLITMWVVYFGVAVVLLIRCGICFELPEVVGLLIYFGLGLLDCWLASWVVWHVGSVDLLGLLCGLEFVLFWIVAMQWFWWLMVLVFPGCL